jgi:hypothetical protein
MCWRPQNRLLGVFGPDLSAHDFAVSRSLAPVGRTAIQERGARGGGSVCERLVRSGRVDGLLHRPAWRLWPNYANGLRWVSVAARGGIDRVRRHRCGGAPLFEIAARCQGATYSFRARRSARRPWLAVPTLLDECGRRRPYGLRVHKTSAPRPARSSHPRPAARGSGLR